MSYSLVEAACPSCKGDGKDVEYLDGPNHPCVVNCDHCNGTGKITNENLDWSRDPAASGWRSRAWPAPEGTGPWEVLVYDTGEWEVRGPPLGETLVQGKAKSVEDGKKWTVRVFEALFEALRNDENETQEGRGS